jgi:hypothetical protein
MQCPIDLMAFLTFTNLVNTCVLRLLTNGSTWCDAIISSSDIAFFVSMRARKIENEDSNLDNASMTLSNALQCGVRFRPGKFNVYAKSAIKC